ncbi:hypothetical protein [Alienimonas californiensis]|uniref:hypothetical protein n=1 Tax=Alienimonas californiensis TaxID=2527989 RepID=UPI0011A50FEC|nr:hypothetical protein [Alienimonas californiensis]
MQIAHIDRDRSNNAEANLVPLCLDHHDEYDSRTSQSKGLLPSELAIYKRKLIADIAEGRLTQDPPPVVEQTVETPAEHDAFTYGVLFADISRILAVHDLVGMVPPAGTDEYDLEVEDVIYMTKTRPESDWPAALRQIFLRWFGSGLPIAEDAFSRLSEDLLAAVRLNERRELSYNPSAAN